MANLQATVVDGKLTVNTEAVVSKYVESSLLRKTGSSSSEITHIFAPKGAQYSNSGGNVSGAIKIALPKLSSATMLRMRVEIFDYAKDESVSMWISGYTYGSNGSHLWTNESVQIITSKLEKDFKVRFGNDGSHSCILIGEESQSWSYPKVVVSEVLVGHSQANVSWAQGWSIGLLTSLSGFTVNRTVNSVSLPMAKYARDSNLLDGLNSTQFLRSDVSNRLVGNMTIAKDYKIFGEDSGGADKTMIYMVASNKKTYVGNLDSGAGVVLQGKLGPQFYDGSTYHNILHTGNDDELVQDIVGKMTTSNTESGIQVTYQDSDGTIDFVNTDKGSSQKIFKNIAVAGQSNIVADSNNDTLTFQSGENIVITTDPNSDKVIIRSPLNHTFPNKVTLTSPNGMLFSGIGEGLEIKNGGDRLGYNDTRLINLRDANPVMDGALIFTNDTNATGDAKSNILELSNGKVASHKNFYAPLIFEGGTQLSNKYLGKTAKAVDSDKLDGVSSEFFARTNIATETFDGGVSTTLNVLCDNGGAATLNLMGGDQGTGTLYVGQSATHGGGIEYNGDNVPSTTGAGSDYIALYRKSSGELHWTARNQHSSNDWEFRGNVKAASLTEGTTPLANKYLGKTAKAVDSDKLDNLNSTQFLRSDVDDTFSGNLVSTSRSKGIFGIYDAKKIDQIWSMGTAYKVEANGANFGNLYGAAYKHTNNATGGTMAGGHQFVWAQNGTPNVALGNNIWTSGKIYEGGVLLESKYVRKDIITSLNKDINFTGGTSGITWDHDTDGASIKFLATNDGATTNRLEFAVRDNGNEYFSWVNDGVTKMTLKSGNLAITGQLDVENKVVVHGDSSKGEASTPTIYFQDDAEINGKIEYSGSAGWSFVYGDNPWGLYIGEGGSITSRENGHFREGLAIGPLSTGDSVSKMTELRFNDAGNSDRAVAGIIKYGESGGWTFNRGDSQRAFIDDSGNFGCNGSIQANGTIRSKADITAFYSSDERIKTNIESIKTPLEKVCSVRTVTYDKLVDAKLDAPKDAERKFETGFIAQDIQAVMPEIVHPDDNGVKRIQTGGHELLALAYGAIKDLKAELDQVKAELAELKGK